MICRCLFFTQFLDGGEVKLLRHSLLNQKLSILFLCLPGESDGSIHVFHGGFSRFRDKDSIGGGGFCSAFLAFPADDIIGIALRVLNILIQISLSLQILRDQGIASVFAGASVEVIPVTVIRRVPPH